MRADPAVEQVHSCPTVKFETPTRCAGPLRLSAHTQQRGVSPGNRQLQAPLASSSSRRVKADAAIASSSRAAREQTPSHAKRHMALEKSKRSVAPATPHVKSGYLAEVAVEELSGCQRTNIDAMEARDLRPHVLANFSTLWRCTSATAQPPATPNTAGLTEVRGRIRIKWGYEPCRQLHRASSRCKQAHDAQCRPCVRHSPAIKRQNWQHKHTSRLQMPLRLQEAERCSVAYS